MKRSTRSSRSKLGHAWLHGPGALLLLGLLAAAYASPVASRVLAVMRGVANSGLQVQNLDLLERATMLVDMYPRAGRGPITIQRPGVGPGWAANVYVPAEATVRNGIYSAIVRSDRETIPLVRTDWGNSGAATLYEGARPGQELLVPLFKGYRLPASGASGAAAALHDSIIDVQNTDTSRSAGPIEARLELRDPSGLALTRWTRQIEPGSSIGIDVAQEPALRTLPDGFAGSLRVSADTPLDAGVSIDVTSWERAAAASQVRPSWHAAHRLHAPLVASGALRSWIVVLNTGDRPVELELSYRRNVDASGDACGEGVMRHGDRAWSIDAGGLAIFAQGPGGGSGLPEGCVASATLLADAPLSAYVLVEDEAMGTAGAYLAASDDEARPRVHLPLFRNRHTRAELSTAIQVMNPGAEDVDLRLRVYGSDGEAIPCPSCQASLPPGSARLWYPPEMEDFRAHTNTYGAVQVEATGPVLAVVSDASATGVIDTAIYRGLAAAEPEAEADLNAPRYAPIVVRGAVVRAPHRIYLPDVKQLGGSAP
ncbi:MAG: hypothetical protein H6648_08255 [Caldilineae bacterium]|nr:hypothetical protein [Caldilineae bacterium]